MPQICPKCHRVNPADALYCYEDGNSLDTRIDRVRPVDPGDGFFLIRSSFPTAPPVATSISSPSPATTNGPSPSS